MKKLYAIAALSLLSFALMPLTSTAAGGGEVKLQQANVDLSNTPAIQLLATYIVNYCMGFHSPQYVRYTHFTESPLKEEDME